MPSYPDHRQICVTIPSALKARAERVFKLRRLKFSPWIVDRIEEQVELLEQKYGIVPQADGTEDGVNVPMGV
jgi:hypothetical protein